jgi:predicted nucleic acid-binding protein
VILADTSVWIEYFRADDAEMRALLGNEQILMHPFVIAELALGSLHDRSKTLARLDRLPRVQVAQLDEVRRMIEVHSLYSKGIGLIDAHLVASCLVMQDVQLWTHDSRLGGVARALGVMAVVPTVN